MADDTFDFAEIIAWLKEDGYSEDEVRKIIEFVRKHDELTKTDSIMDSMAAGNFNLTAIIQEALGDRGEAER
jgi:hypothetical protein